MSLLKKQKITFFFIKKLCKDTSILFLFLFFFFLKNTNQRIQKQMKKNTHTHTNKKYIKRKRLKKKTKEKEKTKTDGFRKKKIYIYIYIYYGNPCTRCTWIFNLFLHWSFPSSFFPILRKNTRQFFFLSSLQPNTY